MQKPLLVGLAAVVLVIALGAGAIWAFSDKTHGPLVPAQEATTTDSSAPPAPSATTTTPTPATKTTAALSERIYDNGVYITPLAVVSDSRCPMGVYCIQAGTVSVKVKLEDATHTETVTAVMGSPIAFGTKHVTLMSVTPPKSQAATILPSDYRFTFSVTYGMGGEVGQGLLSGTMTIGPICPVEQVNNPCKPTPEMYAARKVAVYAANHTTLVTTLTPDANGAFSASLPAGTYYVTLTTTQAGVGSVSGVPVTLVIRDGATTRISIAIDTGIR